MFSADKQVEIAKLGMDAVFGYTQAAINAAFEASSRTLCVYQDVAHAVLPRAPVEEETWEWSGAPRRPRSALLAADRAQERTALDPFSAWATAVRAGYGSWHKAWSKVEAPSPLAWWMWMPQSAVPATWPWAYGMIASGVPGSVAWPMAQANVALMDAARKTAEVAGPVFPAYRSDNGFAAAQMWTQPHVLTVMTAVGPAAGAMWAWRSLAA